MCRLRRTGEGTTTALRLEFAGVVRRRVEERALDLIDAGILRMRHRDLLARRVAQPLADLDDVGGFVRGEPEAEPGAVGDGVEHAAVADVGQHGADAFDLERHVEPRREARHVGDRHAGHAAAVAIGQHRHQAGRRLERETRLRLDHRHDPALEQDRRDAHDVAARHRRVVLGLLHDDDAGVSRGIGRRQDEIHHRRGIAARLAQHQPPEAVLVPLEVLFLLEHGAAGHVQRADATHHDTAVHSGRVGIDGGNSLRELHYILVSRLRVLKSIRRRAGQTPTNRA